MTYALNQAVKDNCIQAVKDNCIARDTTTTHSVRATVLRWPLQMLNYYSPELIF